MQLEKILKRVEAVNSLKELSGVELGLLIKYMTRYEKAPGGPYIFNKPNDVCINYKLYELFAKEGKELSGAQTIGGEKIHHTFNKVTENQLKNSVTPNPLWQLLYNEALTYLDKQQNQLALQSFNIIYKKLISTDKKGEISKLSYYFNASLTSASPLSKSMVLTLDKANCFIWCAYTIFDFIADDKRFKELEGIAKHLTKQARLLYSKVLSGKSPVPYLLKLVDAANRHEAAYQSVVSIRNPDEVFISSIPKPELFYNELANRSIVHIAGPLSIANIFLASEEQNTTFGELSQYCAARQLLDDIHDWKEDFMKSQITYPVAVLLKTAAIMPGKHSLEDTVKAMEGAFFDTVLSICLDEIEVLAQKSITGLETLLLEKDSQFIQLFIAPLMHAAQEARRAHDYNVAALEGFGHLRRPREFTIGD